MSKSNSNRHASALFDTPAPSRRKFLKTGGVALATAVSGKAMAAVPAPNAPERALRLYNTHTGEQSDTVYWADGIYQPDGLTEVSRLLRDHRSNQVGDMNKGLLDLLFLLSSSLDTKERFQVISGYRSPATNAMLQKKSKGSGVATRSLHMDGLAIDIRVPGRDLADVRRAALALQGGGVGYYPESDFVHLDIGRVRTW